MFHSIHSSVFKWRETPPWERVNPSERQKVSYIRTQKKKKKKNSIVETIKESTHWDHWYWSMHSSAEYINIDSISKALYPLWSLQSYIKTLACENSAWPELFPIPFPGSKRLYRFRQKVENCVARMSGTLHVAAGGLTPECLGTASWAGSSTQFTPLSPSTMPGVIYTAGTLPLETSVTCLYLD